MSESNTEDEDDAASDADGAVESGDSVAEADDTQRDAASVYQDDTWHFDARRNRGATDGDVSDELDWSFVYRYDEGSGAGSDLDDYIDRTAIRPDDGRSSTRTSFYPSDADDTERYEKLHRYQEGMWTSERKHENNRADARRDALTVCSQLQFKQSQKDRVIEILKHVDGDELGSIPIEHVIVGATSLVANEYDRFIRMEDGFKRILRAFDMTNMDLRRARRTIHEMNIL